MKIAQTLIDEMVRHAREDAPEECCGMIGGTDGDAASTYRAINAEASPYRYSIASGELLRLIREIDGNNEELVGIYHSHTKSAAHPSQTDINLAGWPDAVYVIISLADPEKPDVRGFWLREGEIEDAELEIV